MTPGPIDAIDDRPAAGSYRPRLLTVMERRIAAIIAREGVFHVPKDMGAFVADV